MPPLSLEECIPEIYSKEVLVIGVGNILFGDDGFGPEVARRLERDGTLPEDAMAVDAGTGARKILFDITLCDRRPGLIVIVDAMDCGKMPGELFEMRAEDLPHVKLDDFSMHQLPASNLLRELQDLCDVQVRIIACQVACIPGSIAPGLSPPVEGAVQKAAALAVQIVKEHLARKG